MTSPQREPDAVFRWYVRGVSVGVVALFIMTFISFWLVERFDLGLHDELTGEKDLSWAGAVIVCLPVSAFLVGVWATVAIGRRRDQSK